MIFHSGIWSDKDRLKALISEIDKRPSNYFSQFLTCPFCVRGNTSTFEDMLWPSHIDEAEFKNLNGGLMQVKKTIFTCQACGWWIAEKKEQETIEGEGFLSTSMVGCDLVPFSKRSYSDQIQEIKNFLLQDFRKNSRDISPYFFEDIVANVFRDIGYEAVVTEKSGDHGIDVFLEKNGEKIGVQVKRYRNRTKVEAIRSLAGAMVLNDVVKGVFVTTDEYQSGCFTTAQEFESRGLKIELIEGTRLLDALEVEQLDSDRDWDGIVNRIGNDWSELSGGQVF